MLERGEAPSQRLLFPLTLHLGPAEADAFEANRDAARAARLRGRGIRRTHAARQQRCRCRIRASTPSAACARRSPRSPATATRRAHARHERLAATVACKAAIKAGDELSPGEMRALFVALARHDASRARRARPLHDRAALVGRARAPLWPTVALHAIPRHLRPDGGGQDARRAPARASAPTSSIVSADSRQLYRGFDIGTAKPTRERAARASASAASTCSIRRSATRPRGGRTRADAWIHEARAAGREPLVVGGTGLYLRALFERLFDEPRSIPSGAPRSARARDARRPRSCGAGCERSTRARAHLGRTQLLRAVEIALLTGRRVSDLHRERARPARWPRALSSSSIRAARSRARIEHADATRCSPRGWRDEVRAPDARRARRRAGVERHRLRRRFVQLVRGDALGARRRASGRHRDAAVRQAAAHLVPASARRRGRDTPRSARCPTGRRAPSRWWTRDEATHEDRDHLLSRPTAARAPSRPSSGSRSPQRGHEIHFITYQQPFRLPVVPAADLLPRGGRRPLSAVRVSAVRPRARGAHARGRADARARPAARALRHPARDERVDRARDARARRGRTSRCSPRCTAPTSPSSGRIRRSTPSPSSRSRSRTGSRPCRDYLRSETQARVRLHGCRIEVIPNFIDPDGLRPVALRAAAPRAGRAAQGADAHLQLPRR